MTTVVPLRAPRPPRRVPTLVLVDLQREHLAAGLLGPDGSEGPLAACRRALDHARATGMPVAHVRRAGRTAFGHAKTFGHAMADRRWIAGFEPNGGDMVFERESPSCYAAGRFEEVMEATGRGFVLAGITLEGACLATAVEAAGRGHAVTVLADACASRPLGGLAAPEVHRAAGAILGLHATVLAADGWIALAGPGVPAGRLAWPRT